VLVLFKHAKLFKVSEHAELSAGITHPLVLDWHFSFNISTHLVEAFEETAKDVQESESTDAVMHISLTNLQ
jgi:hypothetical protein